MDHFTILLSSKEMSVDKQIPSNDTPHIRSRGNVHSCLTRAEWWLDGLNLKVCFASSYCVTPVLRVQKTGLVTSALGPSESHLWWLMPSGMWRTSKNTAVCIVIAVNIPDLTKVLVTWRIYSLLGNNSVYTFLRTHKSRSCVLCGPC
jgi:hypothetical protein